jgi:hypothetical protein
MEALIINEEQLNDPESTINDEGDPACGARVWAENNREVWQPWVEATQNAQESYYKRSRERGVLFRERPRSEAQ